MGESTNTLAKLKMTIKEKIKRALLADPMKTNGQIAHNLNSRVAVVQKIRDSLDLPNAPKGRPKGSKKGKTLEEFRVKHDVGLIIQRKIDSVLSEDSEEYFEDRDFREMCEVPIHSWRRFADSKKFEAYRLKRGGHNLWASPQVILQIKKVLGIE